MDDLGGETRGTHRRGPGGELAAVVVRVFFVRWSGGVRAAGLAATPIVLVGLVRGQSGGGGPESGGGNVAAGMLVPLMRGGTRRSRAPRGLRAGPALAHVVHFLCGAGRSNSKTRFSQMTCTTVGVVLGMTLVRAVGVVLGMTLVRAVAFIQPLCAYRPDAYFGGPADTVVASAAFSVGGWCRGGTVSAVVGVDLSCREGSGTGLYEVAASVSFPAFVKSVGRMVAFEAKFCSAAAAWSSSRSIFEIIGFGFVAGRTVRILWVVSGASCPSSALIYNLATTERRCASVVSSRTATISRRLDSLTDDFNFGRCHGDDTFLANHEWWSWALVFTTVRRKLDGGRAAWYFDYATRLEVVFPPHRRGNKHLIFKNNRHFGVVCEWLFGCLLK
jgi:hypothetical protein